LREPHKSALQSVFTFPDSTGADAQVFESTIVRSRIPAMFWTPFWLQRWCVFVRRATPTFYLELQSLKRFHGSLHSNRWELPVRQRFQISWLQPGIHSLK